MSTNTYPICLSFLNILAGYDTPSYNCSRKSIDYWYSTGTKHLFYGFYYLFLGIVFHSTNVMVLISMIRAKVLQSSCFKLMFFIGLMETIELWPISFFPGLMEIVGGVYCTHPRMQIIFGKMAEFGWVSAATGCILLALNRLGQLSNNRLVTQIFNEQWKTLTLISLTVFCAVCSAFCFDSVVYDSTASSFVFLPYQDAEPSNYKQPILLVFDPTFSAISIIIYFMVFATLITKFQSIWINSSTLQKSLLLQTGLISSIYTIASTCYAYVLFIDGTNLVVGTVAQFFYHYSAGLPCLIYLIFNRTLRRQFMLLLRLKTRVKINVHPLPTIT